MCTNIHIDLSRKIKIDYVVDRFVAPVIYPISTGVIWLEAHYVRIWELDLIYYGGQITIHEFIHYLLWASGQVAHGDPNHTSPLFNQCAPRV